MHLTSMSRLFLMYLLALIFCYAHHGTTLPLAAFYQANPSERRRRLQSNAKGGRRRGNTLNGRTDAGPTEMPPADEVKHLA